MPYSKHNEHGFAALFWAKDALETFELKVEGCECAIAVEVRKHDLGPDDAEGVGIVLERVVWFGRVWAQIKKITPKNPGSSMNFRTVFPTGSALRRRVEWSAGNAVVKGGGGARRGAEVDGRAKVDKPQAAGRRVNHDIIGLYVAVCDPRLEAGLLAFAEVKNHSSRRA